MWYNGRMNKRKIKDWELKSWSGGVISTFHKNPELWRQLFDKQAGCCAICGKHQANLKQTMNVDHNHKTGKIRGLLCHNCNLLLGFAEENIQTLKNAINYLKR